MTARNINILVTYPPIMFTQAQSHEILTMIEAVDPAVAVKDVAELNNREKNGDKAASRKLDALLADTEIIYGFPPPQNVIRRAPKLEWMQTPLTGVDPFLQPDIISSPVIITNSRGIHGTQAGELVIMFMLMLAKKAHALLNSQQRGKWQPFFPALLHSKTIGILGFGSIGRDIARLAQAFGMKVMATRTRYMENSGNTVIVLPPDRMDLLLAESDFVVVTLPLTPETRNILGKAEFEKMKPTACLVNIARGGVIDEEALVQALRSNVIAGAALDVFAVEPLPAESELWKMPNVIVTPHLAGQRDDYYLLATGLFCDNLKQYLSGKKLVNVIDKTKGY